MNDVFKIYLETLDHLLESKHERFGTSDEVSVTFGEVIFYMDESTATYLSERVAIHKVLKDEKMAVVIGDFKVPSTKPEIIIRWLLVGFKNSQGRYHLAIMHELYSDM